MSEEKIKQLQLMEQNMTALLGQRQQFNSQLVEIESALKELKGTEKVYKIIGNIMVSGNKEDISSELRSKKEIVTLRIKNIEKQENAIKEKAEKLQKDIRKEMDIGDEDGK